MRKFSKEPRRKTPLHEVIAEQPNKLLMSPILQALPDEVACVNLAQQLGIEGALQEHVDKFVAKLDNGISPDEAISYIEILNIASTIHSLASKCCKSCSNFECDYRDRE